MTLDALKSASRVMGIKQVSKAVKRGDAECVFVADDADERVIGPLQILCRNRMSRSSVRRRWLTSAMHVALRSARQRRQSSSSLFVKNSGALLRGFNK